MNRRPLTFEEDLIRQAADFPAPSAALRARIIAAAERAGRRRLRMRRAIEAAALLVGLAAGLFVEIPRMQSQTSPTATVDAQPLSGTSAIFAAQARVALCSLGEWAHVERFVRLRELQSQFLRGSF